MARIVYGVAGEGSGHSSRASVIGEHLLAQGHDVRMVSYDRGYRNLRDTFDVFEIAGLHIASADNKVQPLRTAWHNLRRAPEGWKSFRALRGECFQRFAPDVVITDFEPMTAWLAWLRGIPLITIDNQHRLRYMDFPCPAGLRVARFWTALAIWLIVPRPDVSLATTFYFGETLNNRTFLFPPMLRPEVRALTPSDAGHILVYLSFGYDSLLPILQSFPERRFLVYGYDRSTEEGNLSFKPFSKQGFLDDLASASAVVATAGFTLTTEALYLRKPYLALPMDGQFEQQINGYFLEQLGYGANLARANREGVEGFLVRLEEYRTRLAGYDPGAEDAIQAKLDELLADGAALAKRYHRREVGARNGR